MARLEPPHPLRDKDGDGNCDVFQPCERTTMILASTRNLNCGSELPATNHGDSLLKLPKAVNIDEGGNMWDFTVHYNNTENTFQDPDFRIQTLNVFGSDGKITAKLQVLTRRASKASTSLDLKLCLRGIGTSISWLSVPRSFLLNNVYLATRTPFQDLIIQGLRQKTLPLLQWHNTDIETHKEIKDEQFMYNYEKEIEQLKYEVHHTQQEAKKATNKTSKLQQKLGYKLIRIASLEAEVNKLREKLTQQTRELRACHDQVVELKGNIRVFCRCRPLTSNEVGAGHTSVVEFNEVLNNELYVHTHEGAKKSFKFDYVFTPSHNQEDVFLETAPLVVSVLDGYNVCIFAYGQTGTGKTFTMEGSEDNRGVNYRTLEKLFHVASNRKDQCTYDISVSVLEVYNEELRDLLTSSPTSGQNGKKLEIKQVAEGMHPVPGVVEAPVHSIEEVWKVLQTGNRARVVGCTNANKHSSRSHCMLCVMVKGENTVTGECTKSKLWLVDLAGSERIGKTNVSGERLKEAQCINKSLSALGDVIHALASKSSHIPFRNSKITHLLQDSLGGQSKTLMFVQISPNEQDVGETLCSLNFATRVRGVELGIPRKQLDPAELLKYKKLVEKAKQDAFLKDETIKELLEVAKVKEQSFKALSVKVKEKEGLFEVEKKARLIAEDKLKEQHSLIEKQKITIEKLSAELKAKQSCLSKEPAGQKMPPALKASTPRRPPLQERLVDNTDQITEAIQRPKKRAVEYTQKENESNADILPSKPLPRRASMSTMPHQWPSTTPAMPFPSGPPPKRRALHHGQQEQAREEPLVPKIISRRQGRASLCVYPQGQPSSWGLGASAHSPLVNFAEPRRRPSMACPINPPAVENTSTADVGRRVSTVFKDPQNIFLRSPQVHQPSTQRYTANNNAEMNVSNAVVSEGELQNMPRARRVSNINQPHGRPPQHPHQFVNRELQYQPKRLISQAGEEGVDPPKKMKRLTMVPPLPPSSWERPPHPWALPPTPATPARVDVQTAYSLGRLIIAPSLPWERPQQLGGLPPTSPAATPAHIPMLGGAQRVPLTEKKARRQSSYQRERGWNR